MKIRLLSLAAVAAIAFASTAQAEDYIITLKDNTFSPADLVVPANVQINVVVKNEQPIPAEFESSDFDREKVVKAGSEISIKLGPLAPGTYSYVNDFHRETTGTITAK